MNSTPSALNFGNIDAELKALYEKQSLHQVTRASLFNLVLYSPSQERIHDLDEIVAKITEKFPCRIIFIKNDPTAKDDLLNAKVASKKIGKSDSGIVSDYIEIEVAGKYLNRVPFVVLPLLLADLPVYLVWGQDPTLDSEILPQLKNAATRLIYNGSWTNNLQVFASRMEKLLDSIRIDTMDITWGCLSGWRDIINQVFYNLEKVEDLRKAKSLVITYNHKQPHDEIAAIYLQAWLASRLEWKFLAKELFHEQICLLYKYQEHEISVFLKPIKSEETKAGTLHSFELTCDKEVYYSLVKQPGASKVKLHLSSAESCELPCTLPLPNLDFGFNFMREVFYMDQGTHYRGVLQNLALINWEK